MDSRHVYDRGKPSTSGAPLGQLTDSAWLARHTQRVRQYEGPVVFVGDATWGSHQIIHHLPTEDLPLAWLSLEPDDQGDSVYLGNRLADALTSALGRPLLQHGMPYAYGLSILQRCRDALDPFRIAISYADLYPQFVTDIGNALGTAPLVLASDEGLSMPPPNSLIMDQDTLALSLEDAHGLSPNISESALVDLLTESQGALESFLALTHQRYDGPIPLRPTAKGYWYVRGFEEEASIGEVLTSLLYTERWSEALELAVRFKPEQVPAILGASGNYFLAQGLYRQLWRYLNQLDDAQQENEVVLFWLLVTARRVGQATPILERVKTFLRHREAPRLRALYAPLSGDDTSLAQVARAAQTERTPFTLYAYGLELSYDAPEQALEVLHEAVEQAEAEEDGYAVVRNAWSLAATYILVGRYDVGTTWAQWALELFDKYGLKNTYRWLVTANEWAFGRILTGKTAGLETLLEEAEAHLAASVPGLAALVRSTLGDYWLSQDQAQRARPYYEVNAQSSDRSRLGEHAVNLVRTLLELGEHEEALAWARRAQHLAKDREAADLSLGMALSLTDAAAAEPYLSRAAAYYESPIQAVHFTRACGYLAFCRLERGDAASAHRVLADAQPYISALGASGKHYLIGPAPVYQKVFAPTQTGSEHLELMLLGSPYVRLGGQALKLTTRQLEVLALLALYPEGLSGQRLASYLYGEDASAASIKSLLARLREHVPIGARPYRLTAQVEADFTELVARLNQGDILAAVERYRGPLLASAESPRLVEEQRFLERALREAVIFGKDSDALYHLSTVMTDDLELWETLPERLSPSDPRYPVVLSRIQQLRAELAL